MNLAEMYLHSFETGDILCEVQNITTHQVYFSCKYSTKQEISFEMFLCRLVRVFSDIDIMYIDIKSFRNEKCSLCQKSSLEC
jgi:hypothetical protein